MAEKYSIDFFEVSALNGEGIHDLLIAIIDKSILYTEFKKDIEKNIE